MKNRQSLPVLEHKEAIAGAVFFILRPTFRFLSEYPLTIQTVLLF